ncbi:hypothetical protein A3J90_06695 [candidate division WOR-1 bacterium RIFOXYC2_FULL_37_10]|uniref:Glycosyl transferase family 1 n=1 Tax=candidate division WOR-1 bacterium RIFOXYB2_FULL_37_13 TaxID=1802579 RepID=A0A1F4SQ65_UNCSA|nr:MAG: hypothetical protein A2310_07260 [candidate division WOR-1 bacterium RIFOXYB2_FULL_37_13]OGC33386.1 MAG: hypothetical protein A3J90_06695 [candidate division WOR-1 bacterium RIFOXYC2_FULL_37_10]
MKILYDGQIFSFQCYGGISRYFFELMNFFYLDKQIDFDLPLLFSNNNYLQGAPFSRHMPFLKAIKSWKKNQLMNLINIQMSKKKLREKEFDVFHPTYYDAYFLKYIGDHPFVLTVHDLIHEKFSSMFKKNDVAAKFKKILLEKASRIIAVSENTKHDIESIYSISPEKIDVIYHGSSFGQVEAEPIDLEFFGKYLLYVGDRKLYKNFTFFLESISSLLAQDKELYLICIGGREFSKKEITLFKELNIEKKIVFYDFSDGVLAYLYRNAQSFVYPSLYEGFGIPIVDAFSCGCPVIISNTSCFPEVAGDAAEYFDPTDKVSILNSIKKVICNKSLKNQLIEKGFQRMKYFTWAKTAEQTQKTYENVLRDKKPNA